MFGATKPTFGTATTTTGSMFNFNTLGSNTTTSTSGFGFGIPSATTSAGLSSFSFPQSTSGFSLGTGLAAQTQQPVSSANTTTPAANWASIVSAVSVPVLFGDDRDTVIARWNQLQAFWGTGKGYFTSQGNFVNFNADNPFCRFKTVGYSVRPSSKNEDGLVALVFNKSVTDLTNNQTQVVDVLQRILNCPQNYTVCVDGVMELPDNRCEMVVYIMERPAQGPTRRLLASDLYNAMNLQNIKTQLSSQLFIVQVLPKTGFTPEQLKQYLDTPPAGIDPFLWEQAKLDNPDPEQYIPVPLVGFTELNNRLKQQENHAKLQQSRVEMMTEDIRNLQRSQVTMEARIEEYKRRHLELSHRVLRVIVKQEISRKLGFGIQADEEQFRVHLEALQAELNAPTQFKGRLNELMSQMRMQNQLGSAGAESTQQIDSFVQQQITMHLKQQQEGLQHLIDIIKDDLSDINQIDTELKELH